MRLWTALYCLITSRFSQFLEMPSTRSGTSLSSGEVRQLWRYAVATDFHAINSSIETNKRILGYGTEDRYVPFDHLIGKSWFSHSIDSSGKILAIPDGSNIDLYDLDTGERTVLKGHTPAVRIVEFSPVDPNRLVSFAEREGYEDNDQSEIIIWDVEEQRVKERSRNHPPIDEAAKLGVDAAVSHLGNTLDVSSPQVDQMRKALSMIIDRIDIQGRVSPSSRLEGRLRSSFQASVFSHSGEYLIYFPNVSARSNGDDTWDFCLYNILTRATTTLSGHRDSIMWIGFSPDDRLVASAGWDGSFRVHDSSGKELWKWDTDKQNWAAVFSPDGQYLAGTDGSGMVRIWNLETGIETTKFDNGPRWCRTIDWSPDGQYIVVGSEDHGRLRLFAVSNGNIEMVQERELSLDKSNVGDHDPIKRRMLSGFMTVHTAKFLPLNNRDEGKVSMRLIHSVTMDEGIEVFDFDSGKGWRFVPPYNEDGSAQIAKAGDGRDAVLEHVWRKDKGEIGIISPDGIRFWRLE
jgi:WD40 repeat protein